MPEATLREQTPVPSSRRVDHWRVADLDDAPSSLAKSQTEVRILGTVEVRLVQAADGVKGGPPEDLTGPDGEVDVPRRLAGSSRDRCVAVCAPEDPRNLATERRRRTGARLWLLVDKDRRDQCEVWVRSKPPDETLETPRKELRVAVEEAHDLAGRCADSDVAPCRHPEIRLVSNQENPGTVRLHRRRRTVVHHHDLVGNVEAVGRVERTIQQLAIVPRQDDDAHNPAHPGETMADARRGGPSSLGRTDRSSPASMSSS